MRMVLRLAMLASLAMATLFLVGFIRLGSAVVDTMPEGMRRKYRGFL